MYEKQFGLSRRPFRANASGKDVFVGPQTAKLMSGMKKAFPWDLGASANVYDFIQGVRNGKLEAVLDIAARGRYR